VFPDLVFPAIADIESSNFVVATQRTLDIVTYGIDVLSRSVSIYSLDTDVSGSRYTIGYRMRVMTLR
jgi:hypothetical protein